ncbi:MAG: hypothetical protein AAF984_07270 [Verrucomicrobiota bacterium]
MNKKIIVGLKFSFIYFLFISSLGFLFGCFMYFLYFQDKFESLPAMPWNSLVMFAGLPLSFLTCFLAITIGLISALTTPALVVFQQRVISVFLSFLGGVICGILADGIFAIASTMGHIEPGLEMIPVYTIIFALLSPLAGFLTTWNTRHEIIIKKLDIEDKVNRVF